MDNFKTRLTRNAFLFSSWSIWKLACGKNLHACERGQVPFTFSGDWWVFSTAKNIRAKKIYREFSTPVSASHAKTSSNASPIYSHYEYLISESAEFLFSALACDAEQQMILEVCRTFDLQKRCSACFPKFKEQTTPNRKVFKIQ